MNFILFVLLLLSSPALFSQTAAIEKPQDIQAIADPYVQFWDRLYPNGGWSLFCGFKFNEKGESLNHGQILIGHIYPLEWMIESLSCNNRLQCHQKHPVKFKAMETDLHNMYPLWWEIHSSKVDSSYADLPGEDWRFEQCDYERKDQLVEPREIARGNIARAIFYMQQHHGLFIDRELLEVLQKWNSDDPPSEQEIYRNDLIQKIQGNRNPFIDKPGLADGLPSSSHND